MRLLPAFRVPFLLFFALLASCTPVQPTDAPSLLYAGTGTSPNDVKAIAAILKREDLAYSTITSAGLNRMSASDFRPHRLLIVPGGNFVEIGNGLSPITVANLRDAIRNGLNYLGICAGAFFAGHSPYNGLNLTDGVRFGFYSAEARGIRKAAVPIAVGGRATLEHYWEDGPELSGWGKPVGTYPDGTPAIVEGDAGAGHVVLTGFHPEAPDNWREGMAFRTPASEDNAYAAAVIRAALDASSLIGR